MKMVKSLLLVSAAGLVAVSGAQAADLPVKAKPVEYVKVCSLYGAGFYYIPGTDICMKVGGYVRYQVNVGTGNSVSGGPFNGTGGTNNRSTTQDIVQRARAVATFDTRQQTAYGTLRTYLLMGYNQDTTVAPSTSPTVYMTRGFIQIAGFTFGKATSFFDFVSTAAVSYNAGMLWGSDTGDTGQIVGSYTAQFGNGISASIGIEQTRRASTVYGGAAVTAGVYGFPGGGTNPTADNLGAGATAGVASHPDVVGNIRIDQAWGSAQFSAAAHETSAAYFGVGVGGGTAAVPSFVEGNGHPSNKWGYAVSGGLRLNAPMFGPGDYFQAQAIYTEGAIKYVSQNSSGGNTLNYFKGSVVGFGAFEDGVFGGSAVAGLNSIEKTTAWSVMASYEHFWTPALRTSLYGAYIDVSHNTNATALICATGNAASTNFGPTCNPDWSSYAIGSRSQWNVTKDFYVGLDVTYLYLKSASFNSTNTPVVLTGGAAQGKGTNLYTTGNQDAVVAAWRVHRDIVP